MVISHTLLAAWDAIISPTEIESIRQILHALHKTIMRSIILMSKHKLLPIALTFVLATALCSTIFAQSDITCLHSRRGCSCSGHGQLLLNL